MLRIMDIVIVAAIAATVCVAGGCGTVQTTSINSQGNDGRQTSISAATANGVDATSESSSTEGARDSLALEQQRAEDDGILGETSGNTYANEHFDVSLSVPDDFYVKGPDELASGSGELLANSSLGENPSLYEIVSSIDAGKYYHDFVAGDYESGGTVQVSLESVDAKANLYTSPSEYCQLEYDSSRRTVGLDPTLLASGDFAVSGGTGSFVKIRMDDDSGYTWYLGEMMIQVDDYYLCITIMDDYEDLFETLCASVVRFGEPSKCLMNR